MGSIVNGLGKASDIKKNIINKISLYSKIITRPPCLAVILVGIDSSSSLYIKNKIKTCKEVGISCIKYNLEIKISTNFILKLIKGLNEDSTIDGIIIQLPLPKHIDSYKIFELVDPYKDVDGFHPYNVGRLIQCNSLFQPCTSRAVIILLKDIVHSFKGKHAVIIGASNIVGRPIAMELLRLDMTVTVCHKFTKNLKEYIKVADIIIIAVGQSFFINNRYSFKKEAIIVDVGINRCHNGLLVGDVDFFNIVNKVSYITPVPGGVGPMTVISLLENTLFSYKTSIGCSNKI